MKPVVVLADAADDSDLARGFYDSQDSGLGDYFSDSLLSEIESLGLFHGIHPQHYGFYRMLADRFPFGIYYDETPAEIRVFAVLDLRKDPMWIRAELAER